jgi:hydroxymethylpyrimidine/phosphomethylpyrimidine kinase
MNLRPSILCVGGHDPTGGAGIQADIETVTALGARALTLVSALTAQNTRNVAAIWPTPPDAFARQLDLLLADISPTAVKIGMLGSSEIAMALASRLRAFHGAIVLDPVLAAGGGHPLAGNALHTAIVRDVLPLCTLVTPNRGEARTLTGIDDTDEAARTLLAAGTKAVLVTGSDEASGDTAFHDLHLRGQTSTRFGVPLLPGRFHGSGCTLASACATHLAHGNELHAAVDAALTFTLQSLREAEHPGHDQLLPTRIPR